MYTKIIQQYESLNITSRSKVINKIANSLYKELPQDDDAFIEVCNELIKKKEHLVYGVISSWIKKRESTYKLEYMNVYERWVYEEIFNWGSCDLLCYRVLNPMIEKYPSLYDNVLYWTTSDKTYVKRAAAVSLLHSSQTFKVNVSFDLVKKVSNQLITDSDLYVQKGVGWLLKYAYLTYPIETIEYLKSNIMRMSSETFYYALQKFDKQNRDEMVKFRKNKIVEN